MVFWKSFWLLMSKLNNCNSRFSEPKVSKLPILQSNTHHKTNKSCLLSFQMGKRLNPQQLVSHGRMKQVRSQKNNFNFQFQYQNSWALSSLNMKNSTLSTKITLCQTKSSISWTHFWRFQKESELKITSRKSDHFYLQFATLSVERSHHFRTLK